MRLVYDMGRSVGERYVERIKQFYANDSARGSEKKM
jgi:hypothetical protein